MKLADAGDCDGKLEAKLPDYSLEKSKWKNAEGFAESDVPLPQPVDYTPDLIEQFIKGFNKSKKAYNLVLRTARSLYAICCCTWI